jgi:pyruvate dehydrogenase E2 component (dihydrolipoamide acetyltransferase)
MEKGTILEWFKKEGDSYEIGDVIYSIETEKVALEIEAKRPGALARIVVPAGTEAAVGSLLAVVADPGEVLSEQDIEIAILQEKDNILESVASTKEELAKTADSARLVHTSKIKAMPRARKLAKNLGIDLGEIKGTGKDGVVTVKDVETAGGVFANETPKLIERRIVRGIGQRMAETMSRSWREIPQFTQMIWADASELIRVRAVQRERIRELHGFELSLNDLIIQTVLRAVKNAPVVNSSFKGNEILVFEDVNLSVAIATDEGLVVPVIKKAQKLTLVELSLKLRELATRARSRTLMPADLEGATLTVSNLGMFGIETGTPIITPPQAAIVFIGSIAEQPCVLNGSIVIRPLLGVAIAYDHRVLDGRTAANFTMSVKKELESIETVLNEESSEKISESNLKISSLAKKLAERGGIPLVKMQGSGIRGRVMSEDVLSVLEKKNSTDYVSSSITMIEAVAHALNKYPQLRASIMRDEIHIYSSTKII